MKVWIILSLLYDFCLNCSVCIENKTGSEVTKVLKSLINNGYDKNIRPNYEGLPVIVNVTMYINDMSAVSEVQMDYTIDFYFRQLWNDERLAFNYSANLSELRVGADFAKKIWVPDTFFVNGKQVSLHISTTTDTNTLLRIKSNGDVLYSLRLTVVGSCSMDLKYFPMDRQLCRLKIASYGYPTSDMDYNWAEGLDSFGLRNDLYLPTFQIVGYRQTKKFKLLSTGNYTRLICEIRLARSIGYYLNQIYLPAFLIVVISWVPFWLDRDDTHARVGLGVTTVLTMTTLITSTNEALPKISYIKSIDIYLNTCFVMVFASLIEYATVGYFEFKQEDHQIYHLINDKSEKQIIDDNEEKNFIKLLRNQLLGAIPPIRGTRDPNRIDKYSRWVFPIVYFIFNLIYWTICMYISSENINDLITATDR